MRIKKLIEEDMAHKLSILIPSLFSRKDSRERLLKILTPQLTKDIELLTDIDNGEVSIGFKRQRMLEKAKGEYVCFIDDDDMISKDYVRLIFKALKKNPDVVGISLFYYNNNKFCGESFHSLQYDRWWDEIDPNNPSCHLYYRCPNHLNPVKRKLALKAGFPDLNISEDAKYSENLLPLLETEEYIKQPIYYYYKRVKNFNCE